MCDVLGMDGCRSAADGGGRMDVAELRGPPAHGTIGTVVVTAGRTGLGAVDQVRGDRDVVRGSTACACTSTPRTGGSSRLLADDASDGAASTPHLAAIAEADSVVVDPHKHGLQPYGCGAMLFKDPSVGRHYMHDSPYTYFTSDELHLGEISLECSRAGAAAAAFWATVQAFPLDPAIGFGPILRACRAAAVRWDALVADSPVLATYQEAELDIVTYFDRRAMTTSAVDASADRVLHAGMDDADPVFVSTLSVSAADFHRRHPDVVVDSDRVRVLRSVLMKPEHEPAVPWLVRRLEELTVASP